MRHFFGGMGLCLITLLALYVSTVYNKAIATSNTEIIVNSVIVLFVMEFDEWNFSIMGAINEKWTNHEAESEETKESEEEGGKEDEMKKDEVGAIDKRCEEKGDIIAEMKAEIASQNEQISSQQDIINAQGKQLEKLSEIVQKMQESQAAAAAMISTLRTSLNVRVIQMHAN